jgi:hypothetical protein
MERGHVIEIRIPCLYIAALSWQAPPSPVIRDVDTGATRFAQWQIHAPAALGEVTMNYDNRHTPPPRPRAARVEALLASYRVVGITTSPFHK